MHEALNLIDILSTAKKQLGSKTFKTAVKKTNAVP